jgi:hypothetical protein
MICEQKWGPGLQWYSSITFHINFFKAGAPNVVQTSPELKPFPPRPPKCWNWFWHVPPFTVLFHNTLSTSFFEGGSGRQETGVWIQGFVLAKQVCKVGLSHTSSPFHAGYFGNRISLIFYPGEPRTMIFLISTSQEARITHVSHQHPAFLLLSEGGTQSELGRHLLRMVEPPFAWVSQCQGMKANLQFTYPTQMISQRDIYILILKILLSYFF